MKRPQRRRRTAPELPERWDEQDVFGMGAAGVLGFVVEQRRRQEVAAAEELRGVTAWAELHRIDRPEAGYGAVDPDVHAMLVQQEHEALDAGRGPRSFAGPDGVEGQLRLCGENAYRVSEFAVCELAAAMRMSESAARAYVGQGLELRDRLPRLWAQVMAGVLPAWKARRVAEQTIPCGEETAAWVDAQLAGFAHKLSLRRIEACVTAAVQRCEPERAAAEAARAAEQRGVWCEDLGDGTASITARASSPDALAFDQAVGEVAESLAAWGDEDALQVRRSKALGVLGDPQAALELADRAAALASDQGEGAKPGRRPRRRTPLGGPVMQVHVHVSLSDAATLTSGPVARVQAPGVTGPRPWAVVQQWLADLAPGAAVRLSPVIDLNDQTAVDAYEAPARIAEQVEHRDLVCVFPWCGRRGRFDLDHIEEYQPPDEGGPPGQTSAANLARLCRFHHRVKTHSGWDYQREPDGTLTWTSALGHRYRVDRTGTERLG